MATPDWIEDFARSSYKLWRGHDPEAHLPFNVFGLYGYYERLWIEKLNEAVMCLNESGIGVAEAADAMPNPSSCRLMLMLTVMQMRNAGTEPSTEKHLANFFYDVIQHKMNGGDVFAASANNAHTTSMVSDIISSAEWNRADSASARVFGQLCVGLGTLVHGLYNDWFTDYSYEMYGPYTINGKTLLIRDFNDLKPVDVWPETRKLRFKRVRVLASYQNLDCKISYVGCHATYSRQLPESLKSYAICADGRWISAEELEDTASYYLAAAQRQFTEYSRLPLERQKEIYFVQEAYQLRALFELAGMDWKPSEAFYKSVKNQPLLPSPWPDYNLTFKAYKEKFGINRLTAAYA